MDVTEPGLSRGGMVETAAALEEPGEVVGGTVRSLKSLEGVAVAVVLGDGGSNAAKAGADRTARVRSRNWLREAKNVLARVRSACLVDAERESHCCRCGLVILPHCGKTTEARTSSFTDAFASTAAVKSSTLAAPRSSPWKVGNDAAVAGTGSLAAVSVASAL